MTRYVSITHKLTGWNAIKARAEQLGLSLTDEQIKEATAHIKSLAESRQLHLNDVDSILREWTNTSKEGEFAWA